MMNIYLDIDGVILANDKQPANFAKEFLEFVIGRYPTYWLTTHCKGDAEYTLNHISPYFDISTLTVMKKIKPTNWDMSKTEAIDFSKPFLWFDDHIFDFEKRDLIKHNALKSWVEVDLSKNPDQLRKFVRNFPV
jgi:hypothetical protein